MSDSALSSRLSPSSIRSQLQKPRESASAVEEPAAGSADKADPLPKPGDAYRAAGRHGNKPELTLYFVTREFACKGFSYGNLEQLDLVPGDRPGIGPKLILWFNGRVITEVTMEGRHVHSLYHWLGLHQVPWVWEHPSPAEFTEDNAAVISRIGFKQIER